MKEFSSRTILLVSINATYQHTAFGLRYLHANLKDLQSQSLVFEYTLQKDLREIAEHLKQRNPKIIGLSVYIWNARPMLDLVRILRQIMPDTFIVLGGPEVSHESESQEICHLAHFTICGEGEIAFYNLCRQILTEKKPPQKKFLRGPLPDLQHLILPYSLYTDDDIKNRYIYVEASRGCPFKCEYCLSSLDTKVRAFELIQFISELKKLIDRGARSFKFIDRTFNLNIKTCLEILNFFYAHIDLGIFLHFEMVPDRLPEEIKILLTQFPKGSLQFEIGIQTWNPEVAKLISRRCDYEKTKENFHFLTTETHVHTHADLIVGLPGENLESFQRGFDTLYLCQPDEIQVGILKRLKGTPIVRHNQEWGMIYQETPPYQVLQTKNMSFEEIQKMNRFSRYWDLYANSGHFKNFIQMLLKDTPSAFQKFYDFSEFLSDRHNQSFAIALLNLTESAWIYATKILSLPAEDARKVLILDYSIEGKRDIPHFLRNNDSPKKSSLTQNLPLTSMNPATPPRQQRKN